MWRGRVRSTDGGETDAGHRPDAEPRPDTAGEPVPATADAGRSMTTDTASLGRCPECGRRVPSGWTLIEYERENGERAVFAECPSCESVVRPE
jgi:predicted RNA-binding Zn-ribbon protein involved in translation (DUF1610 family)